MEMALNDIINFQIRQFPKQIRTHKQSHTQHKLAGYNGQTD